MLWIIHIPTPPVPVLRTPAAHVLPGPNPGHPALEMSIQGVPLPHQNPLMGHGNVEGM